MPPVCRLYVWWVGTHPPPPERSWGQGYSPAHPLWTLWLTDTCENIIFPQLLLRSVINVVYSSVRNLGLWMKVLQSHPNSVEDKAFSWTWTVSLNYKWQIATSFLYCREYIQNYIERIPLETEQKAHKVIRICEQREMHDQGNQNYLSLISLTEIPISFIRSCR